MTLLPSGRAKPFLDDFDDHRLAPHWTPHYLPHWSSRAASRAAWSIADSVLTLSIPPEHPVWCESVHEPPLRVSALQSAVWSGPVGSTVGQQPFLPGQLVAEEQPEHIGMLVDGGTVSIRARMRLDACSMASLWMVGLERVPEQSGEICVMEVFGSSVEHDGGGTSSEVGMGLHSFRDPATPEDFVAPRLPVNPSELHEYAVRWDRDRAEWSIDGRRVREARRPPAYPLQLMLAVFDFPEGRSDPAAGFVPTLEVDGIRVEPL